MCDCWNGDINWATLIDLPATNFITILRNTQREITALGLEKSSAKLLPKNSVLISFRATIGRIAINNEQSATNQGFKNIIIKNFKKIDVTFLAFCIARNVGKLKLMGEGSTYLEFSKSDLQKIKIPLPPLKIQQQIVAEIEAEQTAIKECKKLITSQEQKIKIKMDEVWG